MVEDSFAQELTDEVAVLKKNEETTRRKIIKLVTETLCKDFEL
jgi:hypothetical protein